MAIHYGYSRNGTASGHQGTEQLAFFLNTKMLPEGKSQSLVDKAGKDFYPLSVIRLIRFVFLFCNNVHPTFAVYIVKVVQ